MAIEIIQEIKAKHLKVGDIIMETEYYMSIHTRHKITFCEINKKRGVIEIVCISKRTGDYKRPTDYSFPLNEIMKKVITLKNILEKL